MTDAEVRLLGGVEIRLGGQPVRLGRRLRALVCLLALDAERTVSLDQLARGMWDDRPPDRVRGSLQTYVSRLRRLLGDEAVSTEATGYVLHVPRHQVDVLRFRDKVASARSGVPEEEERALLDEALATWAGDPFGEELSDWIDRFERPRLVEEHLQAIERRAELDLERGECARSALLLGSLVERNPLRETLWVLLLRALEGAGRGAEALERYEAVRTRLVTELGTDPGPELQQVHRQLLETAAPVSPTPQEVSPSRVVPRQLPAASPAFVGRADHLTTLDEYCAAASPGGVVVVHGPGGSGKTSLAVHWAHLAAAAERFPDGQLFVNLRGFGPGETVSPPTAAGLMLRGLGVSGASVPDDLDARAALLRSLLADRRCLILLDNARDAAQVRPLLPGGPSLVVVTSRRQLRSLTVHEAAVALRLDQMSESDAVALLRARLGASGGEVDMSEEVLAELARLCGHLPVALAIVAERVGRDPDGLSETLVDLREATSRLDVLATGEDEVTDVRAVLDWTLQELDEDAAELFALLGLYPDNPVCSLAASALSGLPWPECRARLDRLAECHLVDALPENWYGVHDLVSAFASEVGVRKLSTSHRRAAVGRLRSWFVHTAENVRALVQAHSSNFRPPEVAPGVEPQIFEDRTQAQLWFSKHRVALGTLIADAERDDDHLTVCGLVSAVAVTLEPTGASVEARALAERGLTSAERTGELHPQGAMANVLGVRAALDGDYQRATELQERARSCFAASDDLLAWGSASIDLADCLVTLGRTREALALLEEARHQSEPVYGDDGAAEALRARIE